MEKEKMDQEQTLNKPLSDTQNPTIQKNGNRNIFIIFGVVLLILIGVGACFLGTRQTNQASLPQVVPRPTTFSTNQATSYKHNPNDESDIDDFLKYPNMTYVDEKVVPPCPSQDEFNPCSAIVYTWKTSDNLKQVIDWYKINKRSYGFTCQAGNQIEDSNGVIKNKVTCSTNGFSYIFLLTSSGNQSTIMYSIPTRFTAYVPKTDLENTAYIAMVNYLESFRNGISKDTKITDYVITDIKNPVLNGDSLTFGVNFSIKPAPGAYLPIGTDNGLGTVDGWQRDKGGSALAKKIGNNYVIQGIATGVGG